MQRSNQNNDAHSIVVEAAAVVELPSGHAAAAGRRRVRKPVAVYSPTNEMNRPQWKTKQRAGEAAGAPASKQAAAGTRGAGAAAATTKQPSAAAKKAAPSKKKKQKKKKGGGATGAAAGKKGGIDDWDGMLHKLKQFVAKNGHCDVPDKLASDEFPELGKWAAIQRRGYHTRNADRWEAEDAANYRYANQRDGSASRFRVGDRVECLYDGGGIYYPATVSKVHADAGGGGVSDLDAEMDTWDGNRSKMKRRRSDRFYDVHYDDDDDELNVHESFLRHMTAKSGLITDLQIAQLDHLKFPWGREAETAKR